MDLESLSPRKATWFVRLFGLTKIPLLAWVLPRVTRVDADGIELVVPLTRRTKNHHGSMYFGALAIGADLAAGVLAMLRLEAARRKTGTRVSMVFKDVEGRFLRRPDGDVRFVCAEGQEIAALVEEALASKERVERRVPVRAFVDGRDGSTEVAAFSLTLSLKRR